jgi:hypothetical protein
MDTPRSQLIVVGLTVERFYPLAATDYQLAAHFAGIDEHRLKRHLRTLLYQVLATGEAAGPGRVVAAHRRLGLTEDDFDRFGHYLLGTLLELRVGPDALVRVGRFLTRIREPMLRRW